MPCAHRSLLAVVTTNLAVVVTRTTRQRVGAYCMFTLRNVPVALDDVEWLVTARPT
jgi:hypothetical protein